MSLEESNAATRAAASWRHPARRGWVDRDEVKRRLHAARVLVISPDVENAGRVFVGLGRLGCPVRLARLSIQAIKMLAEVRPDICVIDADDADRDAPTLRHELLDQGLGEHALFVALIARASPGRRRRLLQSGFDGVINKPLDHLLFPQDLLREVPSLAAGTWWPAGPR